MNYIKILPIVVCVFCLAGCQKTDNADSIEKTTLQETYVSESESQEDMQLNEEEQLHKEETNSDENKFYLEEDMMVEVEDYLMGKDATIESICDFLLISSRSISREETELEETDFIVYENNDEYCKIDEKFNVQNFNGFHESELKEYRWFDKEEVNLFKMKVYSEKGISISVVYSYIDETEIQMIQGISITDGNFVTTRGVRVDDTLESVKEHYGEGILHDVNTYIWSEKESRKHMKIVFNKDDKVEKIILENLPYEYQEVNERPIKTW